MPQRIGILAPSGRDAAVIEGILRGADIMATIEADMESVVSSLMRPEIGALIVAEEALTPQATSRLESWLQAQPLWSDLPIVVLAVAGRPAGPRISLSGRLGNVTILERPLHPLTLISAAQSALRARSRQHQAEDYISALAAERLALQESEARLRESEARYRTLFTSMDEGFCVIEFFDGPHGPLSDYIHIEANAAYERHAGIPQVVGQKLREMVGDEADAWVARYGGVLRTGKSIRFEQELVATHRYLDLSAFRIEPASRKQVAVLFQDITERKRAETALKELNETLEQRVAEAVAEKKLLADLVEGTDAFVQVADADFHWLAINKASQDEFERVYGVRPAVGQSMLDALAHLPEHRAQIEKAWRRALTGEQFTQIEEYGDADRDRRFYELKFNPLLGPDGQMIGAYQFVYDVTERLRDQERLEEATARVHEMAKLETLGQLTGGVAHDFNNLLTPIVGALDVLKRRHESDTRSARLISGAMQAAERASVLVQRLLSFARRQHLETRAVDVGTLVGGLRDMIQRSIGPHINVQLDIAPDLPAARIDPNQLELAVLNLAVNARDAMSGGGMLAIRIDTRSRGAGSGDGLAPGSYVRVAVSDSGVGMDPDTLKRAVEPFFTTKGHGKGTGLGLSMVHGLAAQSGGALRLRSQPGEGTTAELWLPVAEGGAEAALGRHTDMPVQPCSACVLLVDDEYLVRVATAEMLREIGHDVIEVSSPAAALDLLSTDASVDLLITDYLMPKMRGSELIAEARTLRPGLPALLITGYSELSESEAAQLPRLGKPFREADLAVHIARLLNPGNVVGIDTRRKVYDR